MAKKQSELQLKYEANQAARVQLQSQIDQLLAQMDTLKSQSWQIRQQIEAEARTKKAEKKAKKGLTEAQQILIHRLRLEGSSLRMGWRKTATLTWKTLSRLYNGKLQSTAREILVEEQIQISTINRLEELGLIETQPKANPGDYTQYTLTEAGKTIDLPFFNLK